MDRIIEKKKGLQKRHIAYIAAGVLLAGLLGQSLLGGHGSALKVDARSITVGDVRQGQFSEFVRVDGQVQPITVVQLSPEEGGIVRELVVEEGAHVKRGDVIVRLSNSGLDLQILTAEAELAEKRNFLRNTQVTMEQDKLANETEKLQYDMDMTRALRNYRQQEQLYGERLIAREDYLKAREDYELAGRKHALVTERLRQDSILRTIQMEEMEVSLANMRRNIQLVHRRRENLQVRSQIDGELGQLDVVLGQNIQPGQKIGQINDLSDYKIEALIDEHYIDRVRQGLAASFERGGSRFGLTVRKVYPEVRDGRFRADFVFTGSRPANIRSGQTFFINLELGQPAQCLIIPKGAFFQSTGGNWVFVLDADGRRARRRSVRIGRQNPHCYEVLGGLQAGERVVISDYERFKDSEVLVLQQ